jgi:hypothetical protein
MQKMLRVAATLVVMVGGMSLGSARAAHAAGGCPIGDPGGCDWCGNPYGGNCTLVGCSGQTDGSSCSCSYDC